MAGYGRRQTRRPSMGSYIKFAWRDAMELAVLLENEFIPKTAHDLYSSYSQQDLTSLEAQLRPDVTLLIGATVSRRPAIVKRIEREWKSPGPAAMAVLFAIMAQVRAMEELDRLSPGGGNRETCASCYAQEAGRRHSRVVHEFPHDVFCAYGSDADFFGDED